MLYRKHNAMTKQTINNDKTLAGGENPLLAGRYRVVRQLGQGGMGSVWLAEDTQLDDKPFAIKMLPSILVSNKRAYRQLKDEALVAMRLVHPNIVQIRAFEENNGNPFLVMDYIDGQTLDDYLAEKGKLNEEEVIRVLRPIAAALDYAHGEGVVHRDVKPANVMIRKDGHPFILDFGIAREIQETMTRVTGKLSSGTLLYMSPEQLNGASPKAPQDVYSFAAMAYECLSGNPPFHRGQIEYQIVNTAPAPLPAVANSCVGSIMSGLAKKPENRPKNCEGVLAVKKPLPEMPSRPAVDDERTPPIKKLPEERPRENAGGRASKEKAKDVYRTIPEKDRRYLPPDIRASLGGDRKSYVADRRQGGQAARDYEDALKVGNGKQLKSSFKEWWLWLGALVLLLLVYCGFVYKNMKRDGLIFREENKQEVRMDSEESVRHVMQEAERAMSRAKAYGAKSICPNEWSKAWSSWSIGGAEFARHEYDKAKRTFEESAKLFWNCVEQAQKAEEEKRAEAGKPKAYLTATLNGVQKNALVTGGLDENNRHRTPLNVNLNATLGSRGEFSVEYVEDGVKYVGKSGYTVKKGLQNIVIVLSREPEKRIPRPATMNFCRHCRYSLKAYDTLTVNMKCPKCGKNLFN